MIDAVNGWAGHWWSWTTALSVQVAVLVVLAWVVDLALRKRGPAQVRYAVWLVVFARLLLPPSFALPTSVSAHFVGARPSAPRAIVRQTAIDEPVRTGLSPVATGTRTPPTADVAPRATDVETAVPLSFKAYLMLTWIVVSLGLFSWLAVSTRELRRLASCGEAAPRCVGEALERCAARVGLRAAPRAVVTSAVPSVAILGVARPVVLLPEGTVEECTESELEHMLLHELAHVKRGDLWVNACQTVLHIAFWFHPLVWLAGKCLRDLREFCCDVTVSTLLKEDTVMYRETLITAARRMVTSKTRLGLGLLGLFENTESLRARLDHLEEPLWRRARFNRAVSLVVVAALMLFVVPMARSQPEPEEAGTVRAGGEQVPSTSADSEIRTVRTYMGRITGRLMSKDGAIPGLAIDITALMRSNNHVTPSTTCNDADGGFVFDHVSPNSVVSFAVRGHGDWQECALVPFETIDLEPGETREVTVEIAKGVAVTGRILNVASGEPMRRAKVYAQRDVNRKDFSTGFTTVDEDGRFTLHVVPGTHTLSFEPPRPHAGFSVTMKSMDIQAEKAKPIDLGDIALAYEPVTDAAKARTEEARDYPAPATRPLAGIVLDDNGEPAVGIAVMAEQTQQDGSWMGVSARTVSNGVFRMDLPVFSQDTVNIWTLIAGSSSCESLSKAVWRPGTSAYEPVKLVLVPSEGMAAETAMETTEEAAVPEEMEALPTMPLTGRVRDEDGKPVAGLDVTAYWYPCKHKSAEPVTVLTDESGAFRMDVPIAPPDRLNICAVMAKSASGICFAQSAWWPGGPAYQSVELVLAPSDGAIAGKVVDDLGNAVADAEVQVYSTNSNRYSHRVAVTHVKELKRTYLARTASDGSFRIEGLPRNWQALLEISGEAIATDQQPATTFGPEKTFTVPRAAKVTGRVVAREPGLSVDDILVVVRGERPRLRFGTASSEADGSFIIDSVPAGTFYVIASRGISDGEQWAAVPSEAVTLEPGETLELTVEITRGVPVTGRFVDTETREPVPNGCVVSRSGATKTFVSTGISWAGEDGRFTLHLAPGKHSLGFYGRYTYDSSTVSQSKPLTVEEGVPVDLGEISLESVPRIR